MATAVIVDISIANEDNCPKFGMQIDIDVTKSQVLFIFI